MTEITKNTSTDKRGLLNNLMTEVAETPESSSLRELTGHLEDMERLFYQRPSEGINFLEYHQIWWNRYKERYPGLSHAVLATRQKQAENFIYEICICRDKSIAGLFNLVHIVHSVCPEHCELCADDQRWMEYCLEACSADKAELKYRYIVAQKILGKTCLGWEVRDGDYFEEHIWPVVKDKHVRLHQKALQAAKRALVKKRRKSSSQQHTTVRPTGSSNKPSLKPDIFQATKASGAIEELINDETMPKNQVRHDWQPSEQSDIQALSASTDFFLEKPSYEKIVEWLKVKDWLTFDGKVKRQGKDFLSCARYVIDLDWANHGYELEVELVEKLSKEFGLPTEYQLKKYFGSPDSWLKNAKRWHK